VGKHLFTIPICLRRPGSPGYPEGDEDVFRYFEAIPKSNDLSRTAGQRIASFIAALHTKTLESLERLKEEGELDGKGLLVAWHDLMEGPERDYRNAFYKEVVQKAKGFSQEVTDKEAIERKAIQEKVEAEAKGKEKENENEVSHPRFVSFRPPYFSELQAYNRFQSAVRDEHGKPDKPFDSINFAREC
jgi:hypothetical protein